MEDIRDHGIASRQETLQPWRLSWSQGRCPEEYLSGMGEDKVHWGRGEGRTLEEQDQTDTMTLKLQTGSCFFLYRVSAEFKHSYQ